jgi:hypothetical protein
MSQESAYYLEELLDSMSSVGGFSSTLSLAAYVFTALAIYTIAQRRGIKKAWLAWVPVVNVWILGSISDQYRYVVKGEIKNKRKTLLGLNIASVVLSIVMVIVVIVQVVSAAMDLGMAGYVSEQEVFGVLGKFFLTVALVSIPGMVIAVTGFVISSIALYDVYRSCDPENSTLYLVLSLIPGINSITKPLFLFLCRNQDKGMPPRVDAEPVQEPVTYETYEEYTSEL